MKHLAALFLCLMLLCTLLPAAAQEADAPQVNDVGLDLLGSSVHYPQVTGLADKTLERTLNDAIMAAGQIESRLNRVAMLISSPVKLNVSYTHLLTERVFSCAFLADGAVETSRSTQVWSAVNFDLLTGQAITLADLFLDEGAARAHLEQLLENEVAPEMSAHLAAGSLTPLPETFTISPTGLTLYYDVDAFRTLSDRAGTVTLLWTEMRSHLQLQEGSILHALGVYDHLNGTENTPAALTQALDGGDFPGIPAALGQPMDSLVERFRLLNDPDRYEGGRMIALEDGAFRGVYLLTDGLRRDFEESVVLGVRADRLNLYGLCTGYTTRDMWHALLGEPDAVVFIAAEEAEAYRIVPGESWYYTLGNYRLRLHADEQGVLRSVFLLP